MEQIKKYEDLLQSIRDLFKYEKVNGNKARFGLNSNDEFYYESNSCILEESNDLEKIFDFMTNRLYEYQKEEQLNQKSNDDDDDDSNDLNEIIEEVIANKSNIASKGILKIRDFKINGESYNFDIHISQK